jgi:hypothetical protein
MSKKQYAIEMSAIHSYNGDAKCLGLNLVLSWNWCGPRSFIVQVIDLLLLHASQPLEITVFWDVKLCCSVCMLSPSSG